MKNEKTNNASEVSTFDFALNFKVNARVKFADAFWLVARWLGF